jgi:hypothetical protein
MTPFALIQYATRELTHIVPLVIDFNHLRKILRTIYVRYDMFLFQLDAFRI